MAWEDDRPRGVPAARAACQLRTPAALLAQSPVPWPQQNPHAVLLLVSISLNIPLPSQPPSVSSQPYTALQPHSLEPELVVPA